MSIQSIGNLKIGVDMSETETNSTDFLLSPGESSVYGDCFLISVLAPYLKAQMMCSSTRFVYKVPNTLLGLIPIGSNENTMPISAIAAVSTSNKFRVGRALIAIALVLYSLSSFSKNFFPALIILLLGIAYAATSFPMALSVQNHAGGTTSLEVSIFDRAKLERFRQELQNRVFADKDQVRHDEAQNLRMQQAMLQQMQLQQMQMQNQQAQQNSQTPQPLQDE
jgi:hypothetical protein